MTSCTYGKSSQRLAQAVRYSSWSPDRMDSVIPAQYSKSSAACSHARIFDSEHLRNLFILRLGIPIFHPADDLLPALLRIFGIGVCHKVPSLTICPGTASKCHSSFPYNENLSLFMQKINIICIMSISFLCRLNLSRGSPWRQSKRKRLTYELESSAHMKHRMSKG